ncbi:MAG: OmpA family protein [Treponema sp.]|nr:OmpA family protein [Treponema sp.]
MFTAKRLSRTGESMKRGLGGLKRLPVFLVLMALAGGLHAQTATPGQTGRFWSLDFGLATNDTLVEGISFGLVLDPRLSLSPRFMIGSKNQINFSPEGDRTMIVSLETQAYLRWNFLRFGSSMINNIFLQGGVGIMAVYRGNDVQMTRGSVLADGTLGITIPISDRWHVEPSVRAGYPFIMGAAITAGRRFPVGRVAAPVTLTRTEYIEIIRELPPVEIIRELPPVEIVRRILITQVEYVLFGPDIGEYNIGVDRDAMALNDLVLNTVANTLKGNSNLIVRIEGHANPVDHDEAEIKVLVNLSQTRADSVAGLLRERGVAEEQIIVIAHGGGRILASDHDHWNINRRVELIIKHIDFE